MYRQKSTIFLNSPRTIFKLENPVTKPVFFFYIYDLVVLSIQYRILELLDARLLLKTESK